MPFGVSTRWVTDYLSTMGELGLRRKLTLTCHGRKIVLIKKAQESLEHVLGKASVRHQPGRSVEVLGLPPRKERFIREDGSFDLPDGSYSLLRVVAPGR